MGGPAGSRTDTCMSAMSRPGPAVTRQRSAPCRRVSHGPVSLYQSASPSSRLARADDLANRVAIATPLNSSGHDPSLVNGHLYASWCPANGESRCVEENPRCWCSPHCIFPNGARSVAGRAQACGILPSHPSPGGGDAEISTSSEKRAVGMFDCRTDDRHARCAGAFDTPVHERSPDSRR